MVATLEELHRDGHVMYSSAEELLRMAKLKKVE
jgi:hypothetical protein